MAFLKITSSVSSEASLFTASAIRILPSLPVSLIILSTCWINSIAFSGLESSGDNTSVTSVCDSPSNAIKLLSCESLPAIMASRNAPRVSCGLIITDICLNPRETSRSDSWVKLLFRPSTIRPLVVSICVSFHLARLYPNEPLRTPKGVQSSLTLNTPAGPKNLFSNKGFAFML